MKTAPRRKGIGMVWINPFCVSDLSAAAIEIKLEHAKQFGDSAGRAVAFSLFLFAYSCGFLIGPMVAGVVKAKMSWGAATVALATACVMGCIPFGLLILRRRR